MHDKLPIKLTGESVGSLVIRGIAALAISGLAAAAIKLNHKLRQGALPDRDGNNKTAWRIMQFDDNQHEIEFLNADYLAKIDQGVA